MGENLLVGERIDAGRDFIRDFNKYFPVSVACWVVPSDSDVMYLYVASDEIDDSNFDIAYGEMIRKFKSNQWLDLFQVKLVSSSDPIARDAIETRDRYPAKIDTRYQGSSIGGMSIDGAHIYAALSAVKAAQ